LPSWSAERIAVTGRQKLSANLASQQATAASARAVSSMAKSRASSRSPSWRRRATAAAISFQWPGGGAVPELSFQNSAIWVWSGVRVVLLAAPRLSTWLSAAAYSGLSRAGGLGGRNWEGLVNRNGAT